MKLMMTLLYPLLLNATAHASAPRNVQALKSKLEANAAVRGAVQEAKRFAGTAKCAPIKITSFNGDTFTALIDCTRPDSKSSTVIGDGATGQVEVSGSLYDGDPGVLLERIEFHYAG